MVPKMISSSRARVNLLPPPPEQLDDRPMSTHSATLSRGASTLLSRLAVLINSVVLLSLGPHQHLDWLVISVTDILTEGRSNFIVDFVLAF